MMTNKVVLVTGGTGSFGNYIVHRLLKETNVKEIRILSRDEKKQYDMKIHYKNDTRLKFLENGLDSGKGAPMACAMIYWGENYSAFYNEFIKYGAVVDIRILHNEPIEKERTMMKLELK